MYSASIKSDGDSKYHAATRHYEFVIGTDGRGANPIDTVLAGLCGCVGHYTAEYFRGEGIDPGGFGVKAEADLTEDRRRLSDINVEIVMEEGMFDERRKEELLAFVRNCPVHNTLTANSRVKFTLINGDRAGR